MRESGARRLRPPGPAVREAGRGAAAGARPVAHAALPGRVRAAERAAAAARAARPRGSSRCAAEHRHRQVRPDAHLWSEAAVGIARRARVQHRPVRRRDRRAAAGRITRRCSTGAVADPGRRLSELPLLAPEERRQLLERSGPRHALRRRPSGPRACSRSRRRGGRTRWRWSAATSGSPTASSTGGPTAWPGSCARSASGPRSVVALCLERSLELVVGVLGILKAGGAYVPLDPDHPRGAPGLHAARTPRARGPGRDGRARRQAAQPPELTVLTSGRDAADARRSAACGSAG